MSETVHYTGKLIPIYTGDNIEDRCKLILQSEGINELGFCDTYQERLKDEFYQEYYITDYNIYRVEKREIQDYEDIFKASENEDGSVNFTTKYYNGGCSFDEALDTALERMDK